jgi:hypothetical protein
MAIGDRERRNTESNASIVHLSHVQESREFWFQSQRTCSIPGHGRKGCTGKSLQAAFRSDPVLGKSFTIIIIPG